jgi:hypothetical protein
MTDYSGNAFLALRRASHQLKRLRMELKAVIPPWRLASIEMNLDDAITDIDDLSHIYERHLNSPEPYLQPAGTLRINGGSDPALNQIAEEYDEHTGNTR